MTGVTFPAAKSSRRMVRSSLLNLAINMTNFWLTNRDNTGAVIQPARLPIIDGGASTPAPMYIPLGFKTRLHTKNE